MADVGTPSAMAMSTVDAGAEPAQASPSTSTTKPEKPDETAFREAEAKLKKDFENAQKKTKDLEAKFNAAKPNNKESPNGQRQSQLKTELANIRSKQSTNKASRTNVQDRVSALDQKLKAQMQEQKNQRAKLPFKNIEEVDDEIKKLEKEVDSGKMRIVDEKKNLDQISQLRSKRKQFSGVDNIQKNIDSLKQQISDTKKELENPEAKALSAEYDQKQAELNALKAEQDSEYKSRDGHRDAWRAAKDHQSKLFGELKALRDQYFGSKRAFDNWDREARKQQYQRREAERKARDVEYKKRKMEHELEEAREPAYGSELSACDALIRVLDPKSTPEQKAPLLTSKFGAPAQRTVEAGEFKGTKLSKKGDDEEAYFVGSGGKKGKKGRKTQDGAAPSKAADMGIFYAPGVAEQFDMIGVKQPNSAEDQPRVIEEVKAKKQYYKDNQQKKTQENVAAVQKRFDALDVGANGASPATNGATHASLPDPTVAESSIKETNGTSEPLVKDLQADGVDAPVDEVDSTSVNAGQPDDASAASNA